MDNVFIVVKKTKPLKIENERFSLEFSTNEGVFKTEEEAKDYIKKRKKTKDRDDAGCNFVIEPWFVGTV